MSRVVVLTGAVALALVVRPGAPAAEHAPTVRVAFLQGEQLVQVRRPGRAPADAIRRLLAGLTHAEKARSFKTYVPAGTRLRRLTIQRGLATVDLTARFLSFHQFGFVPAYPASHGCLRQAYAVARWTYDFASVGMPVRVLARS